MNIMRKLRGAGGGNTAAQDEANSNPQHTALGLMHLKKLFSEYSHPPHPLSDKERDDKLYNMLPLFCKVFGSNACTDMTDKFRDLSAFCHQVSRLMVNEIRRRASNQSTEAASCAIAQFLEIEGSEEHSNGWMLLSTLNLLASAGEPSLIQVMTSVSLPSTLVKCLYLFFDLPEMTDPDMSQIDSEFTPKERRILVQKIFVQVLVRLCSHASPAEELSRKDDLTLLFSAITSWCPQYNIIWRKSAAEVLMTLSRHGLTAPVVNYIHSKGCVALCIDNMQRGQDLSPLEIVEMFVAVFCFLKDSSEVSQTLLDDFRTCQGYTFLTDFLLKMEQDKSAEANEAIRNLVLMVASLCMCGFTELRPSAASLGNLFQMMNFTLPQPQGRGGSVRNIQAFSVLQNVFMKCSCASVCCTILDAISSIYHSDNANFFILESQHTLPQFAEKIHLKSPDIQEKYFQLLEFIVYQLNFVPCKELISLSLLLKGQQSVSCSIICMQTLLNIVKHNNIFKDVYREVGILEVFVTCLERYANILKAREQAVENGNEYIIGSEDEQLACLVMNCLTVLLSGNSSNATVFRECGGSQCAHSLVIYTDMRNQALGIVRELILTSGGEDDMGTLLGMMHSAPASSLALKSHILKSLLMCLRESHRTRTVFRKVGGFVYVMSVLVSMEGCLRLPPSPPWDALPLSQVLALLHTVFNTITVAMRFEPANAKFFHLEICMTSLCDTLRLLGCFSLRTVIDDSEEFCPSSKEEELFHSVFSGNVIEPNIPDDIPQQLVYACLVMRMLYNIALDTYDKANQSVSFKSPSHKRQNTMESQRSLESPSSGRRITSLNLTPPSPDPVVVHSGVVMAMLQLIPSIQDTEETQQSLTLQVYMMEVVKSLVRSERNQQMMCDTGMPTQLLAVGHKALEQETHPLHPPLQYMLERLATQNLEPKDLRDFLRLGSPLNCLPMDSLFTPASHNAGGPVPLTRVKTLVSMTTPRSHGNSPLPPFVEMDMTAEGFGCLYLPSVAPQSPNGPGVVNVATLTQLDGNIVGGIGSGDRMFPPQTGLSFSTWVCVERFSDPRSDPHCVRLLTLVRNLHSAKDDHLICLAVVLSARDKAIIITTQETPLNHTSADWEPEGFGDSSARVWCPDLLQEGQWHHIVLVLNRAVLKNSSFSIYVDSQLITTQKLHYISQNPGGGAANLTVASSVYGFIGTPPQWRRYSRLCWKQGPCHLLEEVLSPHVVSAIYQRGPHYLGSLQATQVNGLPALVAEEKVVFGLNAKAVTHLTLAKIRKVYSRVDNKSIAKQLGMSSHENATPIRVLHNAAGHLAGPARSLGGVVVGYLGVRVFTPRPVTKMIENVGGCSVLLGLIAMAQDVESLYAGVKALACVIRGNRSMQQEMDRRRGYQTLAMLLRKKRCLLNSHILHLAFSLVGTVDSGRESSSIPHPASFQDLLCDLEVWHQAPGELQRSLLEHLYELVTESSEKRHNLNTMRDMQVVQRLLRVLPEVTSAPTRQVLLSLLGAVLAGQPLPQDLLTFGQLLASTLPSSVVSEHDIVLQECSPRSRQSSIDLDAEQPADAANAILLRNRCLQLLHGLLFTPRNTVNTPFCEEVVNVLGLDWPLLFLQAHLHPSTVVWGLRILVVLGSIPALLTRFREGTGNGGWLQDTELVMHNRMGVVLGYQLGTAVPKSRHSEALSVAGFQHLAFLLTQHIDVAQVYFLLMALMMGQPVKLLPADPKLDLDNVWSFMFGIPASQSVTALSGRVTLCPQAVTVLLAMVHTMLNQDTKSPESLPEWLRDYPVTIIQFLFFLYHNMAELMTVIMSPEVLNALAQTLFPPPHSQVSTPADEIFMDNSLMRSSSRDSMLNSHPARKFVMDFLRVIIVDALSLPVNSKVTPAIDLVLEAAPEGSNVSQQARFQTEVLSTLMEHLLAADVLIGEQAALPVVPGGSAHNITPNVCYLTARIVDKLWQGMLLKDPHEVFDFVLKLITQAKRRGPATVPLEGLYHCLNRTVLFLLSRGTDSIADQVPVLETLHKLTNHRGLVFGAGNHELDFIGCLTYCLLQLTNDQKIMLESNTKTTWHVNPNEDTDELTTKQGHNLMAVAAKRVWEELYVSKKPAIEEVFKMTLSNSKAPELPAVRQLIQESATKLWLTYLESERKASYRNPWEMHNQIQSKIQKVTGGLTRLASRTKVKKEDTIKSRPQLTGAEIEACTLQHVALVKELVELQNKTYSQTQQYMQQYVLEEWLTTEAELTRERGLWGPDMPSRLDKWMLDMTEGPCRMRKKMMKNDLFYLHYPYRPELDSGDNKAIKYKVASSWDSKEWHHKHRATSLLDREYVPEPPADSTTPPTTTAEPLPEPDDRPDNAGLHNLSGLRRAVMRSVSEPEDGVDDGEGEGGAGEDDSTTDNQSILRLLEEHEKISHMFRCARIQGLDTTEGLLLFGKEHLYVVDGFTVLKTREIRDIDSLPPDAVEPILPASAASPRPPHNKKQCSKFAYDDIREVHKRRYLLQPMALEVFSGDGRNYLLAFPRKVRNKVYQRFMAFSTGIADSAQQSVAGQKRTANVEQATGLLSTLIGETSVTQRWVRGEISNFQYLMHLNTLAGRSYNDLMQYPVFPWILADYDTEQLDLSHPATFRDFSKPMGAQSSDRLDQFRKRYKEWDDPHGETPPYHYGTHYSSAMIVCSYLVRMEPFTQHFLRLQGGHFDLADRMFNSVREAWLSASRHNMADVKELIPEFFYLPEFLCNSNNFDLGCKQNGVQLGDVVLPPWAKEDPREFIRVHRQALECDYVSQRLNEWIDLIFGYKQQGQPAVDSTNLFHHLFYEGNVDIYSIDDPLKKNATIGFINNFGQIPKQLFKKPHPAKKLNGRSSVLDPSPLNTPLIGDRLFYHHLDNLRPSLQPIKEVKGPVGQILQYEKSVQAVEQNKVLVPPTYARYVAWGFADHSLRIGSYDSDKAAMVCEEVMAGSGEIVACVCPSPKIIVTAGTSSVVTMWEYSHKQLAVLQCLYGHQDAVTCLACSPAYNVIISGSRDSTAIVWDLSRRIFVRQLRDHAAPIAAVAVNDATGEIATCAGTWLHLWSINGDELACVNTCVGRADRMQQILCVAFSQCREWDAQNVVMTGSTDGVVRMWSMEYVQVPKEDNSSPSEPTVDEKSKESEESGGPKHRVKRHMEKQMSISAEFTADKNGKLVTKSGSESSLSEADGNDNKKDRKRKSKKKPDVQTEEKEKCSDEEKEPSPVPVVRRRRSSTRTNPLFRKSECAPRVDSESDEGGLRPSKSDTSLTDTFVVVTADGDEQPTPPAAAPTPPLRRNRSNNPHTLRQGFVWQRQLVFRSKLTMHTAYDRKDNAEPASITALAVSRDHRVVYVGDTRGRVFSWSVTDAPGRAAADHWLKDEGADGCAACNVRFSLYERRHHCRNCGNVFCSKCSRFESEISRLRILKPVRVCQGCHAALRAQHKGS